MVRSVTVDLLRNAPLLAVLPPAALNELAATAVFVSRRSGARIFEDGSTADSCYVLTSGRAKIVITGTDGADIVIGFVQPYTLVGEIALIDAMPRSAGFVAVDDCHLVRIPGPHFLRLRRFDTFNEQLMIHLAATVRRATEQLRAIYTFDALERVAWCVAQSAATRGSVAGREMVLTPKPSHRELAEMTGSSRETVSRALQRLRQRRWLRWDDDSIYMDTKVFRRYFRTPEHSSLEPTVESTPALRGV